MKTPMIVHAGKGSRPILPSKSAVNQLVQEQPSVVDYAGAGPNVVQNGPSIVGRKP